MIVLLIHDPVTTTRLYEWTIITIEYNNNMKHAKR